MYIYIHIVGIGTIVRVRIQARRVPPCLGFVIWGSMPRVAAPVFDRTTGYPSFWRNIELMTAPILRQIRNSFVQTRAMSGRAAQTSR